jgi:predicted alpha/beta hydrolase family esterase
MSADTPGAPAPVLVVPGLNGSGRGHWQSIWEARDPGLRRVEQHDWVRPCLGDWALALERAVRAAPAPVVLLAHSLGCALVAHWSRAGSAERVGAALLVAPADVDAAGDPTLRSFAPLPLEPLPFETWLVASEDDPFCALERARAIARAWGARLLEAGRSGHLNVASGHGPWTDGEALLAEIRRGVARGAEVAHARAAHAPPAQRAPRDARGGTP